MGVSTNSQKTSMPEDPHIFKLNILSLQQCHQDNQEKERSKLDNIIVPVMMPAIYPSSADLKLKKLEIPSHEVPEENDNNDDGFKTPTSLDHKIPLMLECPGAPMRKNITKTLTPVKRRLVLDMAKEVESMFTISFMQDLNNANNKKLKNGMLMP